jgi:hypothetical protein
MYEMNTNNASDQDWGFYIDIENEHPSTNNFIDTRKRNKKTIISDDLSYCINIHNFSEYSYEDSYEDLYDNFNITNISDDDDLYNNNIYHILKCYKNSFDSTKLTNMIIKVSSTTFATIAVTCVILAII